MGNEWEQSISVGMKGKLYRKVFAGLTKVGVQAFRWFCQRDKVAGLPHPRVLSAWQSERMSVSVVLSVWQSALSAASVALSVWQSARDTVSEALSA